jgi:hypothetical protein
MGVIASLAWTDTVRKLLESNWREDDWFGCDSRVIFHYAMKGEIRFLRGRLKFGDAEANAPFPSVVVVFRPWEFCLKSC